MDVKLIESADIIAMFCRKQINRRRSLPIRSSEMGVLIFIRKNQEPVTPLMISKFFDISKPSVTDMVRSLASKGYLVKKKSLTDKRSYTVFLTDKGNQLLRKTASKYYKTLETLRDRMGHEAFRQMVNLLEEANTLGEDL